MTDPLPAGFAWSVPLENVAGYCIPRSFRARVTLDGLDYSAVMTFGYRWDRHVRLAACAVDRNPANPAPTELRPAWSRLERVALAWAAVPVAPGFELLADPHRKPLRVKYLTIGQVEAGNFGRAYEDVYPRLRDRREHRFGGRETDVRKAAMIWRRYTDQGLLATEIQHKVVDEMQTNWASAGRLLTSAREHGLLPVAIPTGWQLS